ncbi:SMP-30/gluconolactonase/LRE family protein [Pseudomonas syringae group sp. J254-4]|uniref:SMP-30/gluconolactonase/LRE family protein n=1 Tax=Pseudomonas syringae group sp. J254-4 TaxID=3079589 RepID=UPI002908F66B|nr:SMP-30/gluconolactonase/LRE family protein [Pseudomonas syringae group sp. J254-4]MDU8454786.1 SMP-30/gluconolactonase/LRE family protein [Pseudomonas syringae group sp. J254-4]
MRIEIVVDVKTTLGEGPVWDVEQQRLYWIDSFDGRVLRCTDDGRELRAWDVGQKIGSMALRRNGDAALVALQSGIYNLDLPTGDLELIVDPEPGLPNNRLNDGKVDRQGRFIVGSMDTQEDQASAKLYRLDPDLSLHTLDEGIIVSNGPCWSPGGETFYFADTWSGDIWAYDYDNTSGAVANRRTFAKVDTSAGGAADGCTVDAEGCLWQVLVYAGKLVRYTPDGQVDRIIDMPVKKVTSLTFGGPNLDTLYVTSMARPPLPRFPEDCQQRGALFAITGLGVQGIAERRFAS